MTEFTGTTAAAEPKIWSTRTLAGFATLAVLVVLGDLLFWQHEPGISVFIFFAALIAGVLALHPQELRSGRTVLLLAVALLGVLPLIETLSPWALLTAQGAITLLAIGIVRKLPSFEDWATAFTRFGLLAPVRLIGDAFRILSEGGQQKIGGRLLRGAVVWLVPVVFAVLFAWLFSAANPLVEMALRAIQLDRILDFLNPVRVFLWVLIAAFAWPVLVP